MKKKRENLRKQTEKIEGIQYLSNCGLEIDAGNSESMDINNGVNKKNIAVDSYKIVYFDLETTGFENSADILQIAAKTEGRTFLVYIPR